MQFSVLTSLAILATTVAAADELTTYSLVISRDNAVFTKVITSTIGVTNLYAAQYHGDNAPQVYTVGNSAGSASFYNEVAETSNEPVVSSSISVETSAAIETTEATKSSEASQSTSSTVSSSEASIASYEGGAVNAALSFGALGAAFAALLI